MADATVPDRQEAPTADVDEALAGIADLDRVPVAAHVARFDSVHRALSDALSAIDGA